MAGLKTLLAFASMSLSVAWLHSNMNVKQQLTGVSQGRREFVGSLGIIASVLCTSQPVFAVVQEETDKVNLVKGYQRLQYLLDNWEKETTICKVGQENFGGQCERSPLKVMDYLGFRSTNDPLFKADKAMMRLYNSVILPKSKDSEFVEAMEAYTENAEEASGMAYLSSWGESNPGGGKDRVELFLERSRKNVITSRDSLDTIINLLGITP